MQQQQQQFKMINIEFDLEPTMDIKVATQRADAAELNMKRTLITTNAEDDFKGYQSLRSLCKREDYRDTGYMSMEQLAKVMKQAGAYEETPVVRVLFNRYDTKGEKKISIQRFCDGVFGKKAAPSKVKGVPDVLATVRQTILTRGGSNGITSLANTFRMMDTNKSNTLSKDELAVGLKKYGLDLTAEQLDLIFQGFDAATNSSKHGSGDGAIDITEFLVALRGHMNDRREKLVTLAFKQLNPSGSGTVLFSEICKIYDATRHPDVVKKVRSVEEVLLEFISSWDRNGDGDITLAEFMEYYKGLSASIDNDDFFELMIRNAWHLAGGEGAYANTTNLRVYAVRADGSQGVVTVQNDLGLNKKDARAIMERLAQQGDTDIVSLKLTM